MFVRNFSTINWEVANTVSNIIISIIAIVISVIALIKTSRDNNKLLEESSRAYISVYTEALIANKGHYYLVFRNFGNTSAFIEDIKIDEKTREMIKLENKDYIKYLTKSNLAPGQSFTHVVSTNDKEYDYEHISKIIIKYTSGRKTYLEKFEFILGSNTRMPSIDITKGDFEKVFLELYQDEIRKKL